MSVRVGPHHCCREQPHPQCSCDDLIKEWCAPSLWERVCLAVPPESVRLPVEFTSTVSSLLAAWRARQPTSGARSACKWDDVEVLLKASIYRDELALMQEWVLAWLTRMECFPRLHVVSDVPESNASFRGVFRSVPNVSFHTILCRPF